MNINTTNIYSLPQNPNKVLIVIFLFIVQNRWHILLWDIPSVYHWVCLTINISNSFVQLNANCIHSSLNVAVPLHKPCSFIADRLIKITNMCAKLPPGIIIIFLILGVSFHIIYPWYTFHDGIRLILNFHHVICLNNKTFPILKYISSDYLMHTHIRVGNSGWESKVQHYMCKLCSPFVLALLIPYNSLSVMKIHTPLELNYDLAWNHTSSLHVRLIYIPFMSLLRYSISFRSASRSVTRTLLLDTTDA